MPVLDDEDKQWLMGPLKQPDEPKEERQCFYCKRTILLPTRILKTHSTAYYTFTCYVCAMNRLNTGVIDLSLPEKPNGSEQ